MPENADIGLAEVEWPEEAWRTDRAGLEKTIAVLEAESTEIAETTEIAV